MNKEFKNFKDFSELIILEVLNKKIDDIAKSLPEETVSDSLDTIITEIVKKFNADSKNTVFKDYVLKNGQQYDTIEIIKIDNKKDINITHFSNLVFDLDFEIDKDRITSFELILSEITFSKHISEEDVSINYIMEDIKRGFIINKSDFSSMFFLNHDSNSNGFVNIIDSVRDSNNVVGSNSIQEKIKAIATTYQEMMNNNIGNLFMDIFLHVPQLTPEYIEMLELLHDLKVKSIFNENYMINIDQEFEKLKKEFKSLSTIRKNQKTK